MTTTHSLEGLIRLGSDGRELAANCDCEGACACAEQTIEFIGLGDKAGTVIRNPLDLKETSGQACC